MVRISSRVQSWRICVRSKIPCSGVKHTKITCRRRAGTAKNCVTKPWSIAGARRLQSQAVSHLPDSAERKMASITAMIPDRIFERHRHFAVLADRLREKVALNRELIAQGSISVDGAAPRLSAIVDPDRDRLVDRRIERQFRFRCAQPCRATAFAGGRRAACCR